MSALMRVAAPIASGVEMAPLKLRFEYPDLAVVVLLSNHQNVFLISVVVCVMCHFPFHQRAEIQKNKF
jgi:hypothetical protein